MFGIDSTEFLLIIVVAVVVIGPKDLPRALYKVGQVVGKARAMARHFRTGLDTMIREAELEELQKQWDRDNARIMAEHPVQDHAGSETPLIEGSEDAVEAAPVMEASAPVDPLVEAVKASQTPPAAPAEPAEAAETPAEAPKSAPA